MALFSNNFLNILKWLSYSSYQEVPQKSEFLHQKQLWIYSYFYNTKQRVLLIPTIKYRVSQKTWEFSDEFDIVFVMN